MIGAHTQCEVKVDGPYGVREIERMIAMLEVTKRWIEIDDAQKTPAPTLPIEQRADASELSRDQLKDGVSDTAAKAEE
jgi:hypothetical protein